MQERTMTVYICDYCRKKYFRKAAALRHENFCYHNPENIRPCLSCVHLKKKDAVVYTGYDDIGGEPVSFTASLFHCNALNKFLHPPQVAKKGNYFEIVEALNNQMPTSCGSYEEEDDLPF